MAKTTGKRSGKKATKAAAVREFLKNNPESSNVQVRAALNSNGIEITPNYVSVIKGQDRDRAERKRGGPKTRRARKAASTAGVGVHEIKLAASLIRSCGGAQEAKRALAAAEDVARAFETKI